MTKNYHLGVNIAGALKRRNLNGMLSDGGRELSDAEVRATLRADAAKGYTVFCGCDNRREDGGCA